MSETSTQDPTVQDAARQGAYRIGAAARLTGISTHTLRKWEDRYGLVEPRRSAGGERLYSAADVKRLALVKDLAEGGMSLAELAVLSVTELERLFHESHDEPLEAGLTAPGTVTVVAVGAALPTLIAQNAAALRRVRVAAAGSSVEEVRDALDEQSPDVLLLECPVVSADTRARLTEAMRVLAAPAAVVLYGFGARADLDALRRRSVALQRAPADVVEMERLCLGLVASLSEPWPLRPVARPVADDTTVSPARWDQETLIRVAGMSSSIACECPRHLADLIMSLAAFEDYSAACENRDDGDAVLHRYLRITSGTCRALFEDALERVARHEGLSLD